MAAPRMGVSDQLFADGLCELDDPSLFREIYARLKSEIKPVGESENFLVSRLACCQMRLKRAPMLEAQFLAGTLNPRIVETSADRAASDLRVIEFIQMFGDKDGVTPEDVTAALAQMQPVVKNEGYVPRVSSSTVSELFLYQRYERAAEDRFYRTLKELNVLQQLRRRREAEKKPRVTSRRMNRRQ